MSDTSKVEGQQAEAKPEKLQKPARKRAAKAKSERVREAEREKEREDAFASIAQYVNQELTRFRQQFAQADTAPRTPLIGSSINKVMREIQPVAKTHEHPDQGFDFRRIDELLVHLQPMLVEFGIFYYPLKVVSIEQVERPAVNFQTGDRWVNIFTKVVVRYRVESAIDGSFIEVEAAGEAMSEQHFSTPAAQTMAEKTMICDLFAIPVFGEKDPEEITGERSQPSNTVYYAPPAATPTPADEPTTPSLFADLEEQASAPADTAKKRNKNKTKEPQTSVTNAAQQEQAPAKDSPIAGGMIKIVEANLKAKGIAQERLFNQFEVRGWEEIKTSQVQTLLDWIKGA